MALPGVIDITPGIRSLQVHFDSRVLTQDTLLQALADAEDLIGDLDRLQHPLTRHPSAAVLGRSGHLRNHRTSTWPAFAPTRPGARTTSNSSAASTDLSSIEAVRDIVFDARYLVMGLGDVYLGAPVATPLDPRHRLVTTKYNPARTWTPPNVVGIGGAYLCIYGMEGPGGYQLFGRTLQVWNTLAADPGFHRRQALAAAILRPDPFLPGQPCRAYRVAA